MKYFIIIIPVFLFCSCALGKTNKNGFEKEIKDFNFVIGTQTIGSKYKFTEETNLVETALAIQKMGSNLLKFSMGPHYYLTSYDVPENEEVISLTELAHEKSFKQVLDMDFMFYQIWTYEFSTYTDESQKTNKQNNKIKFIGGLSDEHAEASYREIYEFASYLLKTYNGSGKVFMLGNWEGDWHLRSDYDRTKPANTATIEGMIRWFNIRQKAVDDAKRDVPHKNVEVFHYVEMNLSDLAVKGETCVTNSILPYINPDYVSFSAYTATNSPNNEIEMEKMLTEHLNYIESKIKPKPGIAGKRLFIGEYGWPELGLYDNEPASRTPEEINQRENGLLKLV